MATLKANGPELLRISQEQDTPGDRSHMWQRTTRVYHANGAILQKHDVRFRPTASFDPPEGRFYSWGWKKVVSVKNNTNPTERAKSALAQITKGTPGTTQWKIEFKSPTLEAARIENTDHISGGAEVAS